MLLDMITLVLLVPLLFLIIGLGITVAIDPYISREHRRIMMLIIILSVVLIVQNIWEDYIAAGPPHWFLRTTLAICGYIIRPVFIVLFLYIVKPGKKYLGWGLIVLNGLLHLTAYFSPLVFHIDETNHYHGGHLHSLSYVICIILLAHLMYQSFNINRSSPQKGLMIPLFVSLMVVVSIILDKQVGTMVQPITFLTFAVVISSVFYYIWLHLKFVQDHEDDLKARGRMQIMLSQIQPHFLYNTLSAIQYLCEHDPKAAGDTTAKFSRYLQGSMSALKDDGEIPFLQELEHTRIYLDIEQIRYEDALKVEYDIACTDFRLPTLTLQPIVENAVRHGVRGKKGTGTVTIATREYPDHFEIIVSDDGPGFDPEKPMLADDGREHIGIANVRERLTKLCGGTLRIHSEPDKGTLVTIEIPKKQVNAI